MKTKFKVGDKVICLNAVCGNKNVVGKKGIIKKITGTGRLSIGIEFDESINTNSEVNPDLKMYHGWYVSESDIELATNEKIVIYRKDNEVIAKDVNTGKIGVDKCDPRDEFKFEIGAKLALERLNRNVTFKFVCISDYKSIMIPLTKGKIYEAVDGVITYDNGHRGETYYSFKQYTTLNNGVNKHIVEIKDGDDVNEILKQYETIKKGDYWSRVCEIQKRQTDKGLKKYGQVLEDTPDMPISTRLNHIEEELIDALMYIEHLKEISR